MSNQPFLHPGAPPAGKTIFGTPGGSLNSAGLDQGSTRAGIDGEKKVGERLDKIAKRHKGVYVFHSVKLPGHIGDIDHVVMFGNKVIVIDTKMWKTTSTYRIASDSVILRDGETFPGGTVKVIDYVRQMGDYTRMETYGFLTVASGRAHANGKSTGWELVNIDGLETALTKMIGSTYAPDLPATTVKMLSTRVVNPTFSGDWRAVAESERRVKGHHGGYKPYNKPYGTRPTQSRKPEYRPVGNGGCAPTLGLIFYFIALASSAFNAIVSHSMSWSVVFAGVSVGIGLALRRKYQRVKLGNLLMVSGGILGAIVLALTILRM